MSDEIKIGAQRLAEVVPIKAKVAEADEVRAVVREVVEGWISMNCSPDTTMAAMQIAAKVMGGAIATRVAEKLAGRSACEQALRLSDLESQVAALSAELDQAHQAGAALVVRAREADGTVEQLRSAIRSAASIEPSVSEDRCAAVARAHERDSLSWTALDAVPALIGAARQLHELRAKLEALVSDTPAPPRETSASSAAWQAEGRDARQAKIFEWAKAAFSVEESTSLPQRGLRLLEESIEVFQAVGGDPAQAHRLIDFVFDRRIGVLPQELGGVGVCVLAMAAAAGLSADAEEAREAARVLAKPIEELRLRNLAKNAAGFLVKEVGGVGDPGVRDPSAPCVDFDPSPGSDRVCDGDGHYLCRECRHFSPPVEDGGDQ